MRTLIYTIFVYTKIVKNITFSADDELIEQARLRARQQKTTLNVAFRGWLEQYAGKAGSVEGHRELMRRLSYVNSGGKFTRDEMNERGSR